MFIEISNLIIPGIGDNPKDNHKLVEWIIDNLDASVPYHLLGFSPRYKMSDSPPTPLETLEKFAEDALNVGLRYPYVGNIWGSRFEKTYCYNCKQPVIERTGIFVNEINLDRDRCPNCGFKINLIKD